MTYLAKTPEVLLPCPHCGGEAEARDGSSTMPYIRCKSCGCRTGSSWNMDKLKDAWNRRVGRTCRVEVSHGSHGPEPRFPGDVWTMHHVCSECGGAIDRDDAYCKHCGSRVVE